MTSDSYLIELRIGYPRWKLIEPIERVATKFHLSKESPNVPHMSLFGSFTIKDGYTLRDIKRAIDREAHRYDFLPYVIDGWDYRRGDDGWVIAFKIDPSPELKALTIKMVHNLLPYTIPKNTWDFHPENAWFHITLAFKLSDKKFETIRAGLEGKISHANLFQKILTTISNTLSQQRRSILYPIYLPIDALRITIIHRNLIAAEYDLISKKWLDRSEAKSGHNLGSTLKGYRIKKELELIQHINHPDKTIYTIGDLHLGHSNIIKYCCRPFLFSNVNEMNTVLINNWNFTVKPFDTVFFVGDLSVQYPQYYLHKLKGNIVFIRGNHDSGIPTRDSLIYNYHGIDFLFIHDPKQSPSDFPGWIIHGHEHNNNLKKYPFFDPKKRRINVGVELIQYKPIRLKLLYDLIKNNHPTIPYLK